MWTKQPIRSIPNKLIATPYKEQHATTNEIALVLPVSFNVAQNVLFWAFVSMFSVIISFRRYDPTTDALNFQKFLLSQKLLTDLFSIIVVNRSELNKQNKQASTWTSFLHRWKQWWPLEDKTQYYPDYTKGGLLNLVKKFDLKQKELRKPKVPVK